MCLRHHAVTRGAAAGLFAVLLAAAAVPPSGADPAKPFVEPIGDTLTVIQRPLLNIPSFALPGGSFTISCDAPAVSWGWDAELTCGERQVPLAVTAAFYDASTTWWRLTASVPADAPAALFDLHVTASGGIDDVTRHAVKVIPSYRSSYYFVQVTDTHLPTHLNYYQPGASTDTSEIVDLRAVIDDLNLINPEFVLVTGDLINEGELEDFDQHRYYSKAERLLGEFEVPVFLAAGNHDIGGWSSTPPSDGTARRDWWRFFGWKRLSDPPAGAPARTEDYSFDYGPVHYVGLEAYINYDGWRSQIYGSQSFTAAQIEWLQADLAAASGSTSQVLFYHDDFSSQLELSALGVEMALWGHIHHDSGSLTQQPYNLATDLTADGHRSYRVVRVTDGIVTPYATVNAGADGQTVSASFAPANDGTHLVVAASITNGQPIHFENAMVRFRMPKVPGEIHVTGGTLLDADDSGSVLICSVAVDLAAGATQEVSVAIDTTSGVPGPTAVPRLGQNRPNPFAPKTLITFELPHAGSIRLTIYGPDGRLVTRLLDGNADAGPHVVSWNGRDERGLPVPSGTYFYRLDTNEGSRTRRLSLIR